MRSTINHGVDLVDQRALQRMSIHDTAEYRSQGVLSFPSAKKEKKGRGLGSRFVG